MMFYPMRDVPRWSELPERDREEVWKLLSLGQNVQATRYYRQASGLNLAEAKDAIELLLTYSPPKPVIPETKPCPYCGEPLRTLLAQQCFACGADWHVKPPSMA
ncbi:MAG: hypothetical protein ABFD16_02645 [Thermoguttaceae bacterium]